MTWSLIVIDCPDLSRQKKQNQLKFERKDKVNRYINVVRYLKTAQVWFHKPL